ncbi:hypothetical protein L1987_56823 [Smallanthus sonchifolius]|uniref:Uncharacterized protein n=1 Tax=Smallanthus sonchifolius TaxID=185202 RepID=A0ACB9DBT5_9ASTR|nr:hypothetical protein L1987_56823 [Smallanthus sonchifolius]
MDQGYKHFSHLHNLIMHQIPEGVEVSCSGCNSSGTGTVYVCWQCNFFLHEQCFQATRSLKHPSHPPHPLTLVPYPTYPSNSFYCNSCRIMGTGFSYSCADCEFDLHVQCAYSISGAIGFQEAHQFQELVPPSWNGAQNSIPFTPPHSISHVNCHSTPHDQAYVSVAPGHHNPIPTAQNPSMAHNPIPTVHPSLAQNGPSVSIPSVQYPSMSHTGPFVSIPQNGQQDKVIIHFSHPHNLTTVDLKAEKGNDVTCSGCKGTLIGKGYSCYEPNCNFHLHESCFHLKREIQHKSHPEHPLNLLPFAPYNNKNSEFTCNACFGTGKGFTYHCSVCKFDLHISCASLPETVKRPDHEHTLKLFYLCPVQGEECTVTCNVCHGAIQKDRWAYFCESCNNFDTHLGCVDSEVCEKHERDSVSDTQVQLQKLQLEMQMTQQLAQMMASMGASISSLAG